MKREEVDRKIVFTKKLTLVLDLDETLIHFQIDDGKGQFLIRPYAYDLLASAS